MKAWTILLLGLLLSASCDRNSTKTRSKVSAVSSVEVLIDDGEEVGGGKQMPLTCPNGATVKNGRCVLPSQCTGDAQLKDGQCILHPICAAPAILKNGRCVIPKVCPSGSVLKSRDTSTCVIAAMKCPLGSNEDTGGDCVVTTVHCPDGKPPSPTGKCFAAAASCPAGSTLSAAGLCILDVRPRCPEGMARDPDPTKAHCVAVEIFCPEGSTKDDAGRCVAKSISCDSPAVMLNGACVVPVVCPPGSSQDLIDPSRCMISSAVCPDGSVGNNRGECVATCPTGTVEKTPGVCEMLGISLSTSVCSNGKPCDRGQCPAGTIWSPWSNPTMEFCFKNYVTCPGGVWTGRGCVVCGSGRTWSQQFEGCFTVLPIVDPDNPISTVCSGFFVDTACKAYKTLPL